jgi:hypothetical protein
MCVSSANERKTQIGWVVVVGWKAQKWTNVNNYPWKRSPCCILDSDEMVMKSLCLEVLEKYSGD